jgi:hypothetical protein
MSLDVATLEMARILAGVLVIPDITESAVSYVPFNELIREC